MRANRTAAAVLALAALSTSSSALAEEEVRTERPYSISASVGAGTPYGILTAARTWTLTDFLGVETGVGLSSSGPQISLTPRLVHRLSEHATLQLGFGLQGGPHVWREGPFCFSDDCAEKEASIAFWARAEASIQYQWSSGWYIGPYLGIARMLNPDELACRGADEMLSHCETGHTDDGFERVYTGLTLGKAF